jgi:hypothetical protein
MFSHCFSCAVKLLPASHTNPIDSSLDLRSDLNLLLAYTLRCVDTHHQPSQGSSTQFFETRQSPCSVCIALTSQTCHSTFHLVLESYKAPELFIQIQSSSASPCSSLYSISRSNITFHRALNFSDAVAN